MPFSLSMGSTTVFCFLQLRLECPWGDWVIMAECLKEPWAEKVTATEETPLREPIEIWKLEVFTLIFTLIFGMGGRLTSFLVVEGSTFLRSLETISYLQAEAVFLFLVPWLTSVPSIPSSALDFLLVSFLNFFSLPLPVEVAALITSITPLLIGTPVEEPTTKSLPGQEAGKSLALDTQPILAACHSTKLVLLLITIDTIPAVGRAKRLLKVGVDKRSRSGVLPIVPGPS